MPRYGTSKNITPELLHDEVRFVLKTLLRDDLFGEVVLVNEAEKLLESSLSLPFSDYTAFLKRHGFVEIDRVKNTIGVLPRGRSVSEGLHDTALLSALAAHFASRIDGAAAREATVAASPAPPPPGPASAPARTSQWDSLKDVVKVGSSERARPLQDEVVGDRYVKAETIGQGTLGTVHRARNIRLNRDVALKEVRHVFDYVSYIPKDEIVRKLKESVLAQASLDHPHVLQVVDVKFDAETPFVVLEHARGGSLRGRLDRARELPGGVLPTSVSLRILLQASYALQHAHARGVVHGDLKPENVLFDGRGNVLLSDFGSAAVIEKPGMSGPPVYVGVGTPSYMAPEQLHGGSVGAQADIYAMGILLYQLLTGQLPGRRSPMPSQVKKDVPPALDDVFDRMTRDGLDERYQSFDEVLAALYAALPKTEILERGAMLLYEVDPLPPPQAPAPVEDEPAARPEPEAAPPVSSAAEPTVVEKNGAPAKLVTS